ncbi:MAG: dTMP kinase [Rhizobiales bacterium]|nr:dTMP kinase [Hyphomicrobiales bacterium]NRB14933.1 dTMP kinase [Hyphomicrobiales bacterium]
MQQIAKPRGQFISFEGGEGGGKTTQIKLLAEKLTALGIDVVQTREPGGSEAAEQLRKLLLTGDVAAWSPISEALLFAAGRADHLDKLILPKLAQGTWVLCDRFLDSTRAYQGVAGNVPQELITVIEKYVVAQNLPNRTYILDLDPEIGLGRANARMAEIKASQAHMAEDRFENMQMQFHLDLRQCYLDIAANEPARCSLINAEQSVAEIHADIWADAQQLLNQLAEKA